MKSLTFLNYLLISTILFFFNNSLLANEVGSFQNDFNKVDNSSGSGKWRFYWNAPKVPKSTSYENLKSGWIGNPYKYILLVKNELGLWTVDGNTSHTDSGSGNYLFLKKTGGHPGSGGTPSINGTENTADRYAIASFQVATDGIYSITRSYLRKNSLKGDPVEVLIHIDDEAPIFSRIVPPGLTKDFNINLGSLKAGQTIYICFGAYENNTYDSFRTDFKIVKENKSLQQLIDSALEGGKKVPAGFYRTTSKLVVNGKNKKFKNLDLSDVRIINTSSNVGLDIRNTNNFKISGFSYDKSPLPFAQFRIIAIDKSFLDMELIEGYTAKSAIAFDTVRSDVKIFDPTGYPRLVYKNAKNAITQDSNNPRVFHIKLADLSSYGGKSQSVIKDDIVVINTKTNDDAAQPAVQMSNNVKLSIQNVQVFSADLMAFLADGNTDLSFNMINVILGNNHLDYRVRGKKRLQSSNRDGFHINSGMSSRSSYATPSVLITNSRVEYNDDDSVNIRGTGALIHSYDNNKTFYIVNKNNSNVFKTVSDKCKEKARDCEKIGFVNKYGYRVAEARVINTTPTEKTISSDPSKSYFHKFWKTNILNKYNNSIIKLEVNQALNIEKDDKKSKTDGSNNYRIGLGTMVYSIDRSNPYTIIKNNVFGHNRTRGITARANSMKILNNRIEGTGYEGIKIYGDMMNLEGAFPSSVIIRDNIINRGYFSNDKTESRNNYSPIQIGAAAYKTEISGNKFSSGDKECQKRIGGMYNNILIGRGNTLKGGTSHKVKDIGGHSISTELGSNLNLHTDVLVKYNNCTVYD